MNKRGQRLQPIVDLTQKEQDQQLQHLARIQQLIRDDEAKLQELKGYQNDYHRRLQESGFSGMSMGSIQNYHGFMKHLDNAIRSQQDILSKRQESLVLQRERYIKATQRHKALSSVQAQFFNQAEQIQARQEQRETDERNSRIKLAD